MNQRSSYLAIDFGATSGRTILGTLENGKVTLQEISRFPNQIMEINGRCYWNYFFLYSEIIRALKIIGTQSIHIQSLGIDTWGVDFVCFGKDGELLRMPYSYRDVHTQGAADKFFTLMPKEKIYEITGIEIMDINSIFQLFTMKENNNSIYKMIDKILFMPDAFIYLLTGKFIAEYTISSTSQLLNAASKNFDTSILKILNLKTSQFGELVFPGKCVGNITYSVQKQTGLKDVAVIAVAGHDTASAVAAVPASNKNFAYLSSGTWSLMGIETKRPIINEKTCDLNFTNEGGVGGTIRFLKNICGMWLLEKCRKEWNDDSATYANLINACMLAQPFQSFIYPDDPVFVNPKSMIHAIQKFCEASGQKIPIEKGEIVRCIFESLAFRYKQVFSSLQELSSNPIEVLHVIGGGSQNELLNTFTCNAIGIPVVAGPSEATAFGNILLQAKATGAINTIEEIRNVVKNSVELHTYTPSEIVEWESHYQRYLHIAGMLPTVKEGRI